MRKIKLAPGETMREFNARRRLFADCGDVLSMIDRKPGLPSKAAIAAETGLSESRVATCIRALKRGDFPELHRVEYGKRKCKAGPFAGKVVDGWFSMRLSAYQAALAQADEHEHVVVKAVQRGRALRFVQVKTGATTSEAQRALIEIAERLGVDLTDPKLSTADEDALIELVVEAIG
jgi:hypothetical protein